MRDARPLAFFYLLRPGMTVATFDTVKEALKPIVHWGRAAADFTLHGHRARWAVQQRDLVTFGGIGGIKEYLNIYSQKTHTFFRIPVNAISKITTGSTETVLDVRCSRPQSIIHSAHHDEKLRTLPVMGRGKCFTPLRLLTDIDDSNGVRAYREERCSGCGALMKPRSALQLCFNVRPDDKAPENTKTVYFICPNGCARCACNELLPLNTTCANCRESNNAH